jgi:transposase
MPKAIYAREMSRQEREAIQRGLRSASAFSVRRSQIILMSSEEKVSAKQIAERLKISDQCVREAIRAFEAEGLACLQEKTHRKKHIRRKFSPEGLAALEELVHQSPRVYGYHNSLWSLSQLATVSFERGLCSQAVSYETVRLALKALGIDWRRARQHISSPDAHYEAKKAS